MVTTSNRPPDDLYQNGIQRASFLPTIDILKSHCTVHSLNSELDYRKQGKSIPIVKLIAIERERLQVFLEPLGLETEQKINEIFSKLTQGHQGTIVKDSHDMVVHEKHVPIWGRHLVIPHFAEGVAKMSFKELCEASHSASDFLALVSVAHTLVLTDIPQMTLAHRAEARRFITLIDTLYENKVLVVFK